MERKEIERRKNLSQEEINKTIARECKGKKGDELRKCSIKTLKSLRLPFVRYKE